MGPPYSWGRFFLRNSAPLSQKMFWGFLLYSCEVSAFFFVQSLPSSLGLLNQHPCLRDIYDAPWRYIVCDPVFSPRALRVAKSYS